MINIGLIGFGYWGPNLAKNFSQINGVFLHSICEMKKEKAERIKEQYPLTRLVTNFKEINKNKEIDAVAIATPPATHFKLAKDALLSGKHVLVEKPLTTTSRQAEELIKIAQQEKLTLMVGHTFEYNDAVLKLKEHIKSGEIGDILYIYSQRLNLGILRQDINAWWNLAPHDISILLFLLEKFPLRVSAKGLTFFNNSIEDVVFAHLDFDGSISVHIHVSWLDPNKIRKMVVVGTKKMIIYDDVSNDAKLQIFDKGIVKLDRPSGNSYPDSFGEYQLVIRSGNLLVPQISFTEPLRKECMHFIRCIRDKKKPLTDGESGLRVVRILEAVDRSLKNGGKSIKL